MIIFKSHRQAKDVPIITFFAQKKIISITYELRKALEMDGKRIVFFFHESKLFFYLTKDPYEGRILYKMNSRDNSGLYVRNSWMLRDVLKHFNEEYKCKFFVDIKKKRKIGGVECYTMERVSL